MPSVGRVRSTWSWEALGAVLAWLSWVVLTPSGLGQEGRKRMGAFSTDPSTVAKGTGPSDPHPPSHPFFTPQIHRPKLWHIYGQSPELNVGARARVRRSRATSSAAPSQPLQEISVCATKIRFKTSFSRKSTAQSLSEMATRPCPSKVLSACLADSKS